MGMRMTDIWEQILFIVEEKNASNMAIKSTNSLPFFVLCVLLFKLTTSVFNLLPHTLSIKPKMYILNTGVFDSSSFPRARLLN